MSRTILLTGASRGIGLCIAQRCIEQGDRVIGIARDFSSCPLQDENFYPIEHDLSQLETLPELCSQIEKRFSSIDALIANAGQGRFGHLEEFSYVQIRTLMDLNFMSHAFLVRAFLPQMKKRGRGFLLFIGSEAALQGKRAGTIYCASKFALRGFAQALRDECGRSQIRVSMIHPGMVDTDFFDDLPFRPQGKVLSPHLVAETALFLLNHSREAVFDEISLSPPTYSIQRQEKFREKKLSLQINP